MKNSREKYLALYRHLGRLFYAIAAADGNVRPEEALKLKQLITEYWLPVEDSVDDFGTDCAHYIGIVFDWLSETKAPAKECMAAFMKFRKSNPGLFNERIVELTWKTADRIASTYSARNKHELIMLEELRSGLMA
jgi:hypothetical protein